MEVKDCFVIMPFSTTSLQTEEQWTEIFEKLFKPAWEAFGIDCYRTKVPRGSITKDIIEKLYSASIVFADLTDSNPNVMYELGVRHTFKKPSVMVKARGSQIPFDVNDYNVFEYEYTPKGLEDLKEHIELIIQDINKFPDKSDNPVWDFLRTSSFIIDYSRNIETVQKLKAIKEELESNLVRCDTFLEGIKDIRLLDKLDYDGEDMGKLDSEMENFFPIIQSDAITHLKITRYINFTQEDWNILNEIVKFCRWCHFYSSNLGTSMLVEMEKREIDEIREIIKKGVDIINRRILELESK